MGMFSYMFFFGWHLVPLNTEKDRSDSPLPCEGCVKSCLHHVSSKQCKLDHTEFSRNRKLCSCDTLNSCHPMFVDHGFCELYL